mmetsp:Transcript_48465/g.35671  ORF Transcript_48465/g.35671 Transcript_48465/m.35671 type:complete len:147 (+) Transcript_48465:140-580(+)|eukprot:CAMPEP_0202961546 /NCGR_PEP_ID=MMETSP1396-20130829/5608_1 /ASSEMBLY_ACC=CAM_ASM_000872 /TAXON_ID= /ORGANISM="Pseudokeronopsis sp., Strain Brazil" /LENGTH=146 /DNA_ID=CAMNT_0049681449 /DNA_START=140 /DNA_END=580 /DNA_ORIENTATION=+
MNDGNKTYKIRKISKELDGPGLPLNNRTTSHFETEDDVYCYIDIEIDIKKTVKPVATKPINPQDSIMIDNFKTVTKYSYFESGKMTVKVLLEFPGIKNHPKEKITCIFKDRSLELKVMDYKGANYQFSVPKLHCYIEPEKCSYTLK